MNGLLVRFRSFGATLLRSAAYHGYLFRISNRQINGLNLGSGGTRIDGFLNIDANPRCGCDVIGHVERIKLASDSVGAIYGSHILEHIPRERAATLLAEWYRVLRPGGRLYVCVPDQEALFRIYLDNLPLYGTEEGKHLVDRACYLTYGGQTDRHDFHFYGYSFATLRRLLEQAGFKDIRSLDRSSIDLVLPNDVSLVRIGAVPMSLNVEATK